MLNVDDLESLEETLAILCNPTLRDAIRNGGHALRFDLEGKHSARRGD